jgi:DNA modification methylase
MNKIIQGDCLIKLKELEDNSVDSIVTDPPYELGFMGKSWDNTGIANNPLMWKECLRVLKPGGHLLAFSGTRTYHRMASAIEDAGFEVRDMIEWVYGSGFPKSLNISKAMEGVIGKQGKGFKSAGDDGRKAEFKQDLSKRSDYGYVWKPTDENAKQWEGWGTSLKPAHEPICMARKPLAEKTVAENVLKYGTGGIDIDGSRVGTDTITVNRHSGYNSNSLVESTKGKWKGEQEQVSGRFPANLIHDNSEEVRECFPETKSGALKPYKENHQNASSYKFEREKTFEQEANSCNASRFFKSILYYPKSSKSERNKGCEELEEKAKVFNGQSDKPSEDMKDVEKRFTTLPKANNHPTVKPIALMEYLIKMVTPKGGTVLDPFAGSGSTLVASKQNGYQYIGIEMTEEYIPIIEARLK